MKSSNFIRDLLVKVLLVVIFVFLLMYLFPMPNLKPFYNSIFNDNIQTMKDAAEDYYTTERMPSENGKSTKVSLQEMIDKKLIIPFTDKDGNSCNTKKSYVKVTKNDSEYELKVSLTCGKESNYVIEKIGCYNFCPTGNCTLKEAKKAEETAKTPVTTNTDKDGNVKVIVPSSRTAYEYEYAKTVRSENWKVGDWQNNKVKEDSNTKLVATRTQYTGQKKVETGNILYEQVAYGTKNNWTYDENWTTDTKCTGNCALWKERTLYTGQKKVTTGTTEYKHVKYGTKNNWTYDENWTTNTKCTGNCALWKERTLYTGQKQIATTTTQYKHVKYNTKYEWNQTGWTTVKRSDSEDVKLIDTRYTVRKAVNNTTTSCDNWTLDSTWYSSKPADTSTRKYADSPANTKQEATGWVVIDTSLKSKTTHSTIEGDLWYELLPDSFETCTSNCGNDIATRYYYYRVHKRVYGTSYQYKYCTPKTNTTSSYDEKVISSSELEKYKNSGYSVVKTEYNYNVRKTVKYVESAEWTTSITPPSGYEYSGVYSTSTTYKYEQLDKWVTNKAALGEYTYNINTFKQYKYAYNNPTKYLVDIKWTSSITSPSGYEYSGEKATSTKTRYEQLDKWVTNKAALGEYTYNVKTAKQYKYAYSSTTKYLKDTIWTTENVAKDGYILTGNTKNTKKTIYIDLGYWVNSKAELKDYTYNIKSRTQYKYKTRTINTSKDVIWSRSNPGNGYEPTGNSRKIYIQVNRQK